MVNKASKLFHNGVLSCILFNTPCLHDMQLGIFFSSPKKYASILIFLKTYDNRDIPIALLIFNGGGGGSQHKLSDK